MVQNHKVHLACQPFVIIVIARGTSRNTAIGMDEEMCTKISIVNYVVKKGILHYNVANLAIITPKTVVLFARFVQKFVIVHQNASSYKLVLGYNQIRKTGNT